MSLFLLGWLATLSETDSVELSLAGHYKQVSVRELTAAIRTHNQPLQHQAFWNRCIESSEKSRKPKLAN